MRVFSHTVGLFPDCQEAKLDLAVELANQGQTNEALSIIDTVPRSTSRWEMIRANTLADAGRHEEAIPLYETAVAREPGFFLGYERLLGSLQAMGSSLYDHWLRRAAAAVPHSASIANTYAWHLWQLGDTTELAACGWFEGLSDETGRIDVSGRNESDRFLATEAQLLRSCAFALEYRSNEELEASVERLGECAPLRFCAVAAILCGLAANLGREDLVICAYDHICDDCRRNPSVARPSVDHYLALAYHASERYAESVSHVRRALELEPAEQHLLWYLWWGLDEIGELSDAIEVAQELYALTPENHHLPYNLGLMSAKLGHLGSAERYYEATIQLKPDNWRALENLALVQLLCREPETAADTWALAQRAARADYIEVAGAVIVPADLVPPDLPEGTVRAIPQHLLGDLDKAIDRLSLSATLEILERKNHTWESLMSHRRAHSESLTLSLDLLALNEKSDHPIGGQATSVGKHVFSLQDLASITAAPHSPIASDLNAQLAMRLRGDYSVEAARLQDALSDLSALPRPALDSLLEAERRWQEGGSRSYAPDVVCYAKAVEVTLKQYCFDAFRRDLLESPAILEEANTALQDQKVEKAHRFLKFLLQGSHLELGSMTFILRLLNGRTAARLHVLRHFRLYLMDRSPGLTSQLGQNLDLLDEVTDVRNRAAHAESFGRESVSSVREKCLALLRSITDP